MDDGGQATRKAKEKPVRLRDLAEYLGLSTTTVSLVLNNSPVAQTLSQQTRKRVLKAAAELNYKANYFARALNQKRNYLVGILVPDFSEGYNALFITAIESELIEKNYVHFVSSHRWDSKLIHQRLTGFVERGVEGMILINTPTSTFPDVPVAMIGNREVQSPCIQISLDNADGIRQGMEHLYDLGHRRIAHLRGHKGSTDADPRWRAYLETCKSLQLRSDKRAVVQLERVHEGLDPITEGYEATDKLLKSGAEFTAILAFNDMSAVGAIRRLKQQRLRVPEDISVVGFDNVPISQLVDPALTTIAQPIEAMAKLATQEIIRHIEAETRPARHIVVKPELVVRESSGPSPRR